MEPHQSQTHKTVAFFLVGLLSSLVLLGSSSEPPIVHIYDISSLEGGTIVEFIGLLVELRVYDSGTERLVIADAEDGCTIRVVCSDGICPQPSSYASIGDELKVIGKISSSDDGALVFTNSDRITMMRGSETVLSVRTVTSNWVLFEGDTIRINGVLETDGFDSSPRLVECSGGFSIAVGSCQVGLDGLIGQSVIVTARLDFNYRTGSLVLAVFYVVAEP